MSAITVIDGVSVIDNGVITNAEFGAKAENVTYGENSTVAAQIEALNNKRTGHTIVAEDGTSVADMPKLKFINATVTNQTGEGADTTIVEMEEPGFVGTTAQVNSAIQSGDIENGQLVYVTDDYTGGGSGGHVILNSSGVEMDQRSALKFVGATVADDSVNDVTVVTIDVSAGFEVVSSTSAVTNPNNKTIYLVKDTSVLGDDKYKEYIWTSVDGFILIGDTTIDLSNYVTNTTKATSSALGLVKVDGSTITVDSDGTIHGASTPATATNSSLGVVKGDGINTNVDVNGLLTAIKVNGHSVAADVPSNAVFTDTTDYNQLTNKPTLGTAAAKEVDTEVQKDSTNLITSGGVFNALMSLKGLYSWSTATDEQITSMIEKYYSGELTLDDIKSVWSIGDTRTVTLSAMSATGVGESHRSQNVEMQIIDFDHDTLTTAQGGKTKALITIDLKNCLRDASVSDTSGSSNTEHGYMNNSNTNVGGWTSCARRTWCNNVFYNALPTYLKNMVKPVNKLTSAGNQSATINTDSDKCFLLSEIEIFGSITYSKAGEGSQYTYYTTATNRYKLPKWSSSYVSDRWWERSPRGSNATAFCRVYYAGSADAGNASNACGLAPACCL